MIEQFAGVASALWLGVLTSISPCPLASNVAAVSYVARRIDAPGRVMLAGLLYALGRAVTYVTIAAIVVASLLSVPSISFFLQRRMNQFLGPLLILVGLLMLGWIRLPWGAGRGPGALEERLGRAGVRGAFALGVLFALSFCPISAGLFFGGLLPLATGAGSRLLLPAVYGLGTGLPVLILALILAYGAHRISRAFNSLARFERLASRLTAGVFVVAGVYLILAHLVGFSF